MNIAPFELEKYFAKYEFSTKYLLSSSDCESLAMSELLAMADDDASELWNDLTLGYTQVSGHPILREEIAQIYHSLTHANIMCAVPSEGIFLLMNTLLRPRDHVVCMFPGYQSLYEVAQSIGCDVSFWHPDEQQGWNFCLQQLQDLITPSTKLVVVNFPHNRYLHIFLSLGLKQ